VSTIKIENATERYSIQGYCNVASNLLLYLHHPCCSFFLFLFTANIPFQQDFVSFPQITIGEFLF